MNDVADVTSEDFVEGSDVAVDGIVLEDGYELDVLTLENLTTNDVTDETNPVDITNIQDDYEVVIGTNIKTFDVKIAYWEDRDTLTNVLKEATLEYGDNFEELGAHDITQYVPAGMMIQSVTLWKPDETNATPLGYVEEVSVQGIDEDHLFLIKLEEIPEIFYNVEVNIDMPGEATAELAGVQITSSGNDDFGEGVDVSTSFDAADGYKIVRVEWVKYDIDGEEYVIDSGNLSDMSGDLISSIDANYRYTIFTEPYYEVTVVEATGSADTSYWDVQLTSGESEDGDVDLLDPEGSLDVLAGGVLTAEFTPDAGFDLLSVTKNGVPLTITDVNLLTDDITGMDEDVDYVIETVPEPVPALAVVKRVVESSSNPVDKDQWKENETITFEFVVENTGDLPIMGISLFDPLIGADEFIEFNPSLAVGAFSDPIYMTYEASLLPIGSSTNEVYVTGYTETEQETEEAYDSVPFSVISLEPSIAVIKTAVDGYESTTEKTQWNEGENVYYMFEVSNSGEVPFDVVKVDDMDQINWATYIKDGLAVGETKTVWSDGFTLPMDISSFDNTVLVYGYEAMEGYQPSNEVDESMLTELASNEGTESVDVIEVIEDNPSINVIKNVVRSEDDPDPKTSWYKGSTMTFEFVITNNGNVDLYDVELADVLLDSDYEYVTSVVQDMYVAEMLYAGETVKAYITLEAEETGSYINTVDVEGITDNEEVITDDDEVDFTVKRKSTPSPTTYTLTLKTDDGVDFEQYSDGIMVFPAGSKQMSTTVSWKLTS